MIKFSIPMTLPTPNTLMRMHWSRRRRLQKDVCEIVAFCMPPIDRRPLERCRVFVTRYSRRSPDVDSLAGTAKLLLDVLQPPSKRHPEGLGVIADDTPACIVEFHVSHAQGSARTDVRIERVD